MRGRTYDIRGLWNVCISKTSGVIEMIEKIYKNNYMAICDNCGTGQECDNWADVMDFMNEEGWKKRLVDGEFKHYCPECVEVKEP